MTGRPIKPRRLLFFLGVAAFFEGFDVFAITQILPNMRADLDVAPSVGGIAVGLVNTGGFLAYFLVREADRIGRRRMLTVTIAGYTLMSLATAFAPGLTVFVAAQMLARMFLQAEWSISAVFLAEELPAGRRGLGFGMMSGAASAGAITCAGLTPLLLHSPIGWRAVYVVGAVPLFLVAIARRAVPETRLFDRVVAAGRRPVALPLLRILRGRHRRRVLQLALIWFLTYAFAQTAVTFWKEFALAERGLSDAEVGRILATAALVSLPLAFGLGKVMDLLGRRLTAVVVFVTAGLSCVATYSLHAQWALTLAMVGGVFGGSAMGTVLNAFTTELFPTAVRADAFAWSNNLLGRLGGMIAPAVVGPVAGAVGWGPAVMPIALCAGAALVLILLHLPETGGAAFDDQDNKEEHNATFESAA